MSAPINDVPTPRTDAEPKISLPRKWDSETRWVESYVKADFARQLERELDEAKAATRFAISESVADKAAAVLAERKACAEIVRGIADGCAFSKQSDGYHACIRAIDFILHGRGQPDAISTNEAKGA